MRGDGKTRKAHVAVNPPAAWLGARNAILWGTGRQYHVPDFQGPLSIKTVVRGSARWRTSDGERVVDESTYLVLNSGQSYTITIDSSEMVETFCLFFRRGMAEDACQVESSSADKLLDSPAGQTTGGNRAEDLNPGRTAGGLGVPAEFFENLHAHDSAVSPLVRRIHARLQDKTASDLWLEDQFFFAAAALVRIQREAGQQVATIPAKKYSTRLELYRRLLRGKDYLDSYFAGCVHLDEVAAQACLSPYHFHRLFREVFRETPNQYLQRRRLATARRLLGRGEQSVTDVCLQVGFESVTSFSALFRLHFGCSPREYRNRR